jgi:16S rRNA (cytosine967-C5)-methyltransferase
VIWLGAGSPEIDPIRPEITAGMPPCPGSAEAKAAALGADVDALSPAWLRGECPAAFRPPLRDVLLRRAPLWLRLQAPGAGAVRQEFEANGWPWQESALLPGALRLPPRGMDVVRTRAYEAGLVEIQDLGSQLILAGSPPAPGGRWLDACAGAGGKALQLAALLGESGVVTARDSRPAALAELTARAARAGLGARIRVGDPADPDGGFDGVLVDAPCTGSGTWRRFPHLKWTTKPEAPERFARIQLRLLRENAGRVRPAGLLVYSTCSLCSSENEAVARDFLSAEPGFKLEEQRPLLPQEHDGDGFFVARFRRA